MSGAASSFPSIPDAPIEDDFEARVLCTDPLCIGLVGPDGRCAECGAAGPILTDEQRAQMARAARTDADAEAQADVPVEAVREALETAAGAASADAFDDRQLCPDAGCIGILGEDGRCKVCGLSR